MFIEVFYLACDLQGIRTGHTFEFGTTEKTVAAFTSLKSIESTPTPGNFYFNLHKRNGDVQASIFVSPKEYEKLTGTKALTQAEYLAAEREFDMNLRIVS